MNISKERPIFLIMDARSGIFVNDTRQIRRRLPYSLLQRSVDSPYSAYDTVATFQGRELKRIIKVGLKSVSNPDPIDPKTPIDEVIKSLGDGNSLS